MNRKSIPFFAFPIAFLRRFRKSLTRMTSGADQLFESLVPVAPDLGGEGFTPSELCFMTPPVASDFLAEGRCSQQPKRTVRARF